MLKLAAGGQLPGRDRPQKSTLWPSEVWAHVASDGASTKHLHYKLFPREGAVKAEQGVEQGYPHPTKYRQSISQGSMKERMSASTTFAATENVRSKGDMTVLTLCLPHSLGSHCLSPKLQILEMSVRLRPILRLPPKEGGSPTTKTAVCCATRLVLPGPVSEVTS